MYQWQSGHDLSVPMLHYQCQSGHDLWTINYQCQSGHDLYKQCPISVYLLRSGFLFEEQLLSHCNQSGVYSNRHVFGYLCYRLS